MKKPVRDTPLEGLKPGDQDFGDLTLAAGERVVVVVDEQGMYRGREGKIVGRTPRKVLKSGLLSRPVELPYLVQFDDIALPMKSRWYHGSDLRRPGRLDENPDYVREP